MQPSQMAIEREFEALRDIKRRSTSGGGPGALILDPDLPAQPPTTTPPLSPQAWTAGDDTGSPTRGHEDDSSSGEGSAGSDDPFHLFWVPAHLHPELAPSEFRAFLKEHARGPSDGSAATLTRSSSSASSLGRKSSMLSRQYRPRDNDGVEEEHVVPLRRNKSIYKEGPQLTISDLQKLEELADEASKSDDPTKLRKVLRRSMSLNVAPSFLDQMDDVPDNSDDADAPIIVPPPNQILRRAARTKIRKPHLAGDGGGHRFAATRRKSAGRTNSIDAVSSLTDGSSSGHGEIEPFQMPPLPINKAQDESEEPFENRRLTYTEESLIFDAYADSPEDVKPPSPKSISPPSTCATIEIPIPSPPSVSSISEPISLSQQQSSSLAQPVPVLYQPQPRRQLSSVIQQQQTSQQISRTPSPDVASATSSFEISRTDSRSSITSEAPSTQSTLSTSADKRKEKDKKSIWRKVGGSDKNAKKGGKEKDAIREREKEKDGGFFGSLFGGGKKKQEEQTSSGLGGGAGPATAAALLGASKSSNKAYTPSISPQLGNPYARYPIHVERAVYRLSHIKLANPRRPLYEQVLISNLMFWYLGVINKSQQGPGQNQNQQAREQVGGAQGVQGAQSQPQDGMQTPPATGSEKDHLEREEREKAERDRAERDRAEAKQRMEQQREPRRGSLTKPAPGASASNARRAEMPVKGPQYHIQSKVIEQEYNAVPSSAPVVRTSSAPPPSTPPSQGYSGGYSQRSPTGQPPKQQQQMYSQPNGNQNYYYRRSGSVDMVGAPPQPSSSNLPSGAMHPISTNEQLWLASQSLSNPPPRSPSMSSPSQSYSYSSDYAHTQQPSPRSPPLNHQYSNHEWARDVERDASGTAKVPSRSLSANAAVPVPNAGHHGSHNGGLKKKVVSASAVSPDRRHRTSEEEDVPLAVWQQQHRK